MRLKLTGGSLTLSVGILAAAWTLRSLQEQRRRRGASSAPVGSSKHAAALSADAIALLVHLQPLPFCIIDVRAADAAAAAPLPAWLVPAVHIPEPQLQHALSSTSGWDSFAQPPLLPPQQPSAAAAAAAAAALAGSQPPPPRLPAKHHLLVLVCDGAAQQQQALASVAAAGYDRVAVPAGGTPQVLLLQQQQQGLAPAAAAGAASGSHSSSLGLAQAGQPQLPAAAGAAAAAACSFPAIHADALAVLLGLAPLPEEAWHLLLSQAHQQQQQGPPQPPAQQHPPSRSSSPRHSRSHSSSSLPGAGADGGPSQQQQQQQRLLVLDVRRHDERSLFGTIPGAHHLQVDELASALQLPPPDFRRRHHFDPPEGGHDVVVVHSRAERRARWAAQLLADGGCQHVLVYEGGVLGWQFGMAVEAYPPYQQGEAPPQPEALPLRAPDVACGVMELQQLGLLPLLMQQHGRLPPGG